MVLAKSRTCPCVTSGAAAVSALGDVLEAMREFLRPYPRYTGLTGTTNAIDSVKREFRKGPPPCTQELLAGDKKTAAIGRQLSLNRKPVQRFARAKRAEKLLGNLVG